VDRLRRIVDIHHSVFQVNYEEFESTVIIDRSPGNEFARAGLGGLRLRNERERRLFNLLSLAKMLDEVLLVNVAEAGDTALLADFRCELTVRVSGDQVVRFMHRLRDYASHYILPLVGSEGRLVFDRETSGFAGRWRFYLDRDELLKWPEPSSMSPRGYRGGWRGVRPFLERQPEEIDVRQFAAHYHQRLSGLCGWLQERLRASSDEEQDSS
jgi:hypothetical protein